MNSRPKVKSPPRAFLDAENPSGATRPHYMTLRSSRLFPPQNGRAQGIYRLLRRGSTPLDRHPESRFSRPALTGRPLLPRKTARRPNTKFPALAEGALRTHGPVSTRSHFQNYCRAPPRGSLAMYVLIKDLQRSGVHVCANKELTSSQGENHRRFSETYSPDLTS